MEVKEEGDEGNRKERLRVPQITYFSICLESTLSRSISDDVSILIRDSCGRKTDLCTTDSVSFEPPFNIPFLSHCLFTCIIQVACLLNVNRFNRWKLNVSRGKIQADVFATDCAGLRVML